MRSDNLAKTINKDTSTKTKTKTIVNRGNNDNGN
jgi:hypothetical protein